MDWERLQAEHKAWLSQNYPAQPAEIPAAGVVEESGELLHAVLKLEQERLWGREERHKNLDEQFADAVGDCAIYCCSLCTALGWSFQGVVLDSQTVYANADLLNSARRLVQRSVVATEAPYKKQHLSDYIALLRCIAELYGGSNALERCVQITWDKVRKRVRVPKKVCLCGSTRFWKEFQQANFDETMAGSIVLTVGCFDRDVSSDAKIRLDELHKRKIDLADEVLVICPGDYIGESTRSEIDYAIANGKPVRYRK